MSATETVPKQSAPTYIRISEIPGADLNIHTLRFVPDQGLGSLHLHTLLSVLTGAAKGDSTGYYPCGSPETWQTLRDIDPETIEATIRRVERAHPGWKLSSGEAVSILDKLDTHFATAQARKRREG